MTTELRFVCSLLAVWRLTHLLAEEDGPADAVARLREALGDGVAGRAMDCFYCTSVWLAAPLALFVTRTPIPWAVTWLALSGGACLLERATSPRAAAPDAQTAVQDRAASRAPASVPPTPFNPSTRAVRDGELHDLLWTTTGGLPGAEPSRGAGASPGSGSRITPFGRARLPR